MVMGNPRVVSAERLLYSRMGEDASEGELVLKLQGSATEGGISAFWMGSHMTVLMYENFLLLVGRLRCQKVNLDLPLSVSVIAGNCLSANIDSSVRVFNSKRCSLPHLINSQIARCTVTKETSHDAG